MQYSLAALIIIQLLCLHFLKSMNTSRCSVNTMEDIKGTPESDYSIECFQNYTAPEVFIQGLAGIVNQQDVESMIRAQKQMLQRFEKTNEMLTNCNALCASRLKTVGPEFKRHTQLLQDMKKDLDYIFKKIRAIKSKLSTQYPDALAEAQRSSLAEECKEDEQRSEILELEVKPGPSNESNFETKTKLIEENSENENALANLS